MKAMVLAAGLGTRLRPHSAILPKPAMPFLNIPLIYYPIHILERLNINELVVNTHHLPEKLMPALRSYPDMNFKLHISAESEEILGSGGGVGRARAQLGGAGDFALINGDELIFPSSIRVLAQLLVQHQREQALATLLIMKHPEAGRRFGGVWTTPDGRVHGFGKSPPAAEHATETVPYHFTGLQILSERIFSYIPTGVSNIFYDVMVEAIARGEKVMGFLDDCTWYESGSLDDFLSATRICLEKMQQGRESPWLKEVFVRYWPDFGLRPSLWEGVDCHHHLGRLSRYPILLGDRVRIHESVEIKGFAVVGAGCVIGEGCVLKDCVIRPQAQIPPGTHIDTNLYL